MHKAAIAILLLGISLILLIAERVQEIVFGGDAAVAMSIIAFVVSREVASEDVGGRERNIILGLLLTGLGIWKTIFDRKVISRRCHTETLNSIIYCHVIIAVRNVYLDRRHIFWIELTSFCLYLFFLFDRREGLVITHDSMIERRKNVNNYLSYFAKWERNVKRMKAKYNLLTPF